MPKRKRVNNDETDADYFDLTDFLNYVKDTKDSEEMADLMALFYNYKESKGEFKHPSKFMKKYCKDYIHDIQFIDGKDALRILKKNNSDPVKFIQFLDALGDSISLSNPKHSKKSFHQEFSLVVTFIDSVNEFLKCFPEWTDENKTEFFKMLFLYPEHSYFLSHNKNQLFEAFPLLETIPKLGQIDDDVVIESDADENGDLKGFISSEDELLSDSDNDNNRDNNKPEYENKKKRKFSCDSDVFESLEEDNGNSDDDDDDDLESVVVEENSDEDNSNKEEKGNDDNDMSDESDNLSDDDDNDNLPNNPFLELSASESENEGNEDENGDIVEKSKTEKITFI